MSNISVPRNVPTTLILFRLKFILWTFVNHTFSKDNLLNISQVLNIQFYNNVLLECLNEAVEFSLASSFLYPLNRKFLVHQLVAWLSLQLLKSGLVLKLGLLKLGSYFALIVFCEFVYFLGWFYHFGWLNFFILKHPLVKILASSVNIKIKSHQTNGLSMIIFFLPYGHNLCDLCVLVLIP